MVDITKGLNSKRFLFTYLIIIGLILVLWMNQLPLMHEDKRQIPIDMQEYLESPPRHLPQLALNTDKKQVLTNDWFVGKWSFVYFSHGQCFPGCSSPLETLKSIQSSFANNDFQFLVVGLDGENETALELSGFLTRQGFDFDVGDTASPEKLEELTRAFIALFLTTNYTDGSYLIEQEHHIFVVDPKGRVYATFRPPYEDTAALQAKFLKLRHFYAKTE